MLACKSKGGGRETQAFLSAALRLRPILANFSFSKQQDENAA